MTRLDDEIDRLTRVLGDSLGSDMLGIYLHGSAALGGWVAGASDLDVLAVSSAQTCDPDALVAACQEVSSPVELSVISRDAAARSAAPWPFVLHVTTHPDKCVRDQGSGDPDLLMHIAVTRAHGRALVGPEPLDMFGTVPDDAIAGYLVSELQWGLDHGTEAYAVLNACRALCWSRTGRLVSKVDGGVWAIQRLPDRAILIGRALADQRAGRRNAARRDEVQALVDAVRAELVVSGEPTQ